MVYCGLCDRHFASNYSLNQHRRDSPRHNICFKCEPELDFDDDDDLAEHKVNEHNLCRECYVFFSSWSNLKNVGLTLFPTQSCASPEALTCNI